MTSLKAALMSDGSQGALKACEWVRQHFTPQDIQITIVTVSHAPIDVGSPNFAPLPAYAEGMDDSAVIQAWDANKKTLKALPDFHPRSVVIGGRAIVPTILGYLQKEPHDVIITGRRSRVVSRILMGSVSGELAGHSPIPVWVIP